MKRMICCLILATLTLFCCIASADAAVLTLPVGLKEIETEAFYGDTSIDEVVLPEGIEKIGANAFTDSSLTKINLPDSLLSIEDNALGQNEHVIVTANEGTKAYYWAMAYGYLDATPYTPHHICAETFNGTNIRMSWDAVAGADGYHVEYATKAFAEDRGTIIPTSETTYTLRGLQPNTHYWIRVAAYYMDAGYRYWDEDEIIEIQTGEIETHVPVTEISLLGETGHNIFMGYGNVGYRDTYLHEFIQIIPEDASNHQLSWSSTNPDVATIDDTGVITGVSIGKTRFIATATDLDVSAGSNTPSISGFYYVAPEKAKNVQTSVANTVLTVTWDAVKDADAYQVLVIAVKDEQDWVERNLIKGICECRIENLTPNTEYSVCVYTGAAIGERGEVIYGNEGSDVVDVTTGSSSEDVRIRNIEFEKYVIQLKPAETYAAGEKARIIPTSASNRRLRWTSSNEAIAKVDADTGLITAIAGGKATITATAQDGSDVSCSINVNVEDDITAVLTTGELVLMVGEISQPDLYILPLATTAITDIAWSSDQPSIALVDRETGEITAVSAGSAKITVTATSKYGTVKNATCVVIVRDIEIEEVSLNRSSFQLITEDSANLAVMLLPENCTESCATVWESSDPSVASIHPETGKMTAISIGTATMTATVTTITGKVFTASCELTVNKRVFETEIPPLNASLNKESLTMAVGESEKLNVEYNDDIGLGEMHSYYTLDYIYDVKTDTYKTQIGDYRKKIVDGERNLLTEMNQWTSSDESIATVDYWGNVKAIAEGTATITVVSHFNYDRTTTFQCDVTVTALEVPGAGEGIEAGLPKEPKDPEENNNGNSDLIVAGLSQAPVAGAENTNSDEADGKALMPGR